MPQLDLTLLESKIAWIILGHADEARKEFPIFQQKAANDAFETLFDKVYRAYRGMPPQEVA